MRQVQVTVPADRSDDIVSVLQDNCKVSSLFRYTEDNISCIQFYARPAARASSVHPPPPAGFSPGASRGSTGHGARQGVGRRGGGGGPWSWFQRPTARSRSLSVQHLEHPRLRALSSPGGSTCDEAGPGHRARGPLRRYRERPPGQLQGFVALPLHGGQHLLHPVLCPPRRTSIFRTSAPTRGIFPGRQPREHRARGAAGGRPAWGWGRTLELVPKRTRQCAS